MSRWRLGSACLAAAVIAIAGCSSSNTNSTAASGGKGPLYILVATDLTGPISSYGIRALHAIQASADLVNQEGGVLGRQLVVRSADAGSDSGKGALAMRQLLSSVPTNDVLFATGAVINGASQVPEVSAKGLVFTTANISDLSAGNRVFEMYASAQAVYAADVAALAHVAPHTKISVLAPDDPTSQPLLDVVKSSAPKCGLGYVPGILASLTATDFTPQLQKLRSEGVKAIFAQISNPAAMVAIAQGARQIGWNNLQIVSGVIGAPVLTELGSSYTNFHAVDVKQTIGNVALSPRMQKYEQLLKKYGPIQDLGTEAAAYGDMVSYMAWAAGQAKSVNPAALVHALENVPSSGIPADKLLLDPAHPGFTATQHYTSANQYTNYWGMLSPSAVHNGRFASGEPFSLCPGELSGS